MYTLEFTQRAETDIKHLKRYNKVGFKKLETFLKELLEHPKYGTGQVEQLKEDRQGQWSRRINREDRLVYSINDTLNTVLILQAKGHY